MKRNSYIFQKKILIILMSLIDFIGSIIFCFRKKQKPNSFKNILVIRLDHLGDIVLSTPFLNELRSQHPGSKITFLTSTAGYALVKRFLEEPKIVDEIEVLDVHWFYPKEKSNVFNSISLLKKTVSEINPDLIYDLRGDFRHIFSSRFGANSAWIISYGITGGHFLLDECVQCDESIHESRKSLKLLKPDLADKEITLDNRIASIPFNDELNKILPQKVRPWVFIHPNAGREEKLWPIPYWVKLIKKIKSSLDVDIFWIGDSKTRLLVKQIEFNLSDDVKGVMLTGVVPIESLGSLFKLGDILISTDSGPTHIAASQSIKTIVLFSTVNDPDIWMPINRNAKLLFERNDNPMQSMEAISPDLVFESLKGMLK